MTRDDAERHEREFLSTVSDEEIRALYSAARSGDKAAHHKLGEVLSSLLREVKPGHETTRMTAREYEAMHALAILALFADEGE